MMSRIFLRACVLLIGLLVIAAAVVLWAPPAYPQQPPQCGPVIPFIKMLVDEHKERLLAVAVSSNGQFAMQLYVNPDKRNWSMVGIDARGIACIMAAGEGFETVPGPPTGDPL